MKKFLGILVAVLLCVSMIAPAASAATASNMDIASALEGLDLDNLNAADVANILGVDLSNLSSVLEGLKSSGAGNSAVDKVIKKLSADGSSSSTTTTAASGGSSDIMGTISSLLGGFDISSIASGDMLSSITDMFSGLDTSSFDLSSLTDMISGVFGDSGIDLSSITGALGDFDISSILGGLTGGSGSGTGSSSESGSGNDSSGGGSDIIAKIVNGLKDGLSGLGLDASFLDGLMDNEVVNFFANLYQGIGGVGGDDSKTTTAPTTAKSPSSPKTGDTSAVFAAMGTLCVASAAAFICLKTKKSEED